MDINQKFDLVLLNNKIIKEIQFERTIEIIHCLEKKILSGSKVGLYGLGIEAESLLSFISTHTNYFKINVCFDKTIRTYEYKDIIQNSKVNTIESITSTNVDYIILGSLTYRDTFLENLNALSYGGKVVDLYRYLEDYIVDHFVDYKMVFKTRQEYMQANGSQKIQLLQKLIKEHLLLKDFDTSFVYIKEYISNQYPDYIRYQKLEGELHQLLQEIEGRIRQRNKKDIIINWIDALSYYDIPSFPFLKRKGKEGVKFENAYTVIPWTTETTKTILCGEYPIEGKLFLRKYISEKNAELLKILRENGYGFGYCGMPKFAKLFDEWIIAPVNCYDNKFSGSMQKQWDALNILCQNEGPMCILIHTLRETHEPFICGEGETFNYYNSTKAGWKQSGCIEQAEFSGKYIDNQLDFYEKFYNENAVEIFMSDHGRVGNSPMDENKIHTMLTICGKSIKNASINNMFSLVKFPELIKKIIEEESDWENLTGQYVIIENLDAYDERIVLQTLSGQLAKEEMYQCRGIVTKQDRYYLYAYGKEYYFVGDELEENRIDDQKYIDRVEKLKRICGDGFIDIYLYDKFQYSRLLYDDGIGINDRGELI